MNNFVFTDRVVENGIWFLKKDDLLAFDSFIDEQLERLEEAKKVEIEREVNNNFKQKIAVLKDLGNKPEKTEEDLERIREGIHTNVIMSYNFSRDNRAITIEFVSKKKCVVKKFQEVINDVSLNSEKPKSFKVELTRGTISATIELHTGFLQEAVDISVRPSESEEAGRLIEYLQLWFKSKKTPIWQLLWARWWWLSWSILWCFFWTSLLFADNSSTERWRQEGRSLLRRGITPADDRQVMKLILSILSDLPGTQPKHNGWLLVLTVVGVALALMLSIHPRSMIAVGEGEKSIEFWQKWTKFVFSTVLVGFFFSGIIIPILKQFITFEWNN